MISKTEDEKTFLVIPARLESKRFPGKVLAELNGKTILEHVWNAASQAMTDSSVFIASDSAAVLDAARGFGANVFENKVSAHNGTERVAEFARNHSADYYLNVQADDPGITAELIAEQLTQRGKGISVSTPIFKSRDTAGYNTSSSPKTVIDKNHNALYFSRSPIPHDRDSSRTPTYFGHVGVYLYSRDALLAYRDEGSCSIEEIEKLEQLRFLHMGIKINTFLTDYVPKPIDTPDDLEFWLGGVNG